MGTPPNMESGGNSGGAGPCKCGGGGTCASEPAVKSNLRGGGVGEERIADTVGDDAG